MSRTYWFGEFRVNADSRELWRGDRLVTLPPSVFDCLVYLLERPDRAVGRDELVAAVWGKTEISDTLLGQTVLRIRRELGDDAKQQTMLRTIPRFGYRWVAPLETTPAADLAAGIAPVPAAPRDVDDEHPTVSARSGVRIAAGLLVLAALIGIATWAWRARTPTAITAPDQQASAAVLPAGVESGAEWSWMRLGVMDIVAARLRSSGVPSVPSESVVALLHAPAAQRSNNLHETLAVRYLVTPHVQHDQGLWHVDLDAEDRSGQHFNASAQARDANAAARSATDQLLAALGLHAQSMPDESPTRSILIKRVDAAVLADDPDTARALIAQASAEEQQAPELRLRLAKIEFRSGRYTAAHERLVGLLDEAPEQTTPVLRASVFNGLGAVAIRESKPEQAEQAFGRAIALLEKHADAEQLGQAYLGRAAAAAEQRHFADATADYARARIAFRQANDTLALIRVAADEGFADLEQDRPAQALPQLVDAAEGFTHWGALNEAILAYIGQIACDLALLDARSALQAADAASELGQRLDNPVTQASLNLARARALAANGRLREARALLGRLREVPAEPAISAAAAGVLAHLELERGNATAAHELAEEAVAKLDQAADARLRAEAWLTDIRARLTGTETSDAATATAAFEQWAVQTGDPRAGVLAQLARAEYSARFDSANSWRDAFVTARELAARTGVPYEIAAVARSHADALFTAGDRDAAAVEVGRITRWSDQDFDSALLEARLYAVLGRHTEYQAALTRAHALAGERELPAAFGAPIPVLPADN